MLSNFKSPVNSGRWLFVLLAMLVMSQAFGHGMSEAEKQIIIEGGNLHYLWIGATHMLSGYDHLLFIFGIIFFLTRFSDIVKYITAFTLGHSVTLLYATFMGLQINYFLIDAVIALSVRYIAFSNLVAKIGDKHNINFHGSYVRPMQTDNIGKRYYKIGGKVKAVEFIDRPVNRPGSIGGHCVMPNLKLLPKSILSCFSSITSIISSILSKLLDKGFSIKR